MRKVIANHNAPWYTPNIKRISNKKKRLYKSVKTSGNVNRWTAKKSASNQYITAIKTAKNFLRNTLPSMLSTDIKKICRTIKPSDNDTITLVDISGNTIHPNDCATILNDAFTANFSVIQVILYLPYNNLITPACPL